MQRTQAPRVLDLPHRVLYQDHSPLSPASDSDVPSHALWCGCYGVHSGGWSVVCAAAVEAMTRFLWAFHWAEEEMEDGLDSTQSLITTFFLVIQMSGLSDPYNQMTILVRRDSPCVVVGLFLELPS